MELDELFAEVEPLIKYGRVEPYGRGKDFKLAAVQADIRAGFRICTKCNERKTLDNFSKRSAHVTGYKGWCKACDKKAFDAYAEKNGDKLRASYRASYYKNEYGLNEELSKTLANPDTRVMSCPICRKTSRLVLDHNHTTGVTRELICSSCNSILGYAIESIDTLYEAIAYLKKHRGV